MAAKIKFDHDKIECAKCVKMPGGDLVLDLPVEEVNKADLPPVTIITVTKNRKHLFPLAIDNWKNIYYPYDALTWLVIDDSDNIEDGPVRLLKELKDNRIQYYRMLPKENGTNTVGYKRNFAMNLVKTDYVVFMDDDDFLYKDSIIARICVLKFYDKQCVYSDTLGVYDTVTENSYIVEKFADIPEGSILCTKKFWEKQKFNEEGTSEGLQMVSGRELDMIKIPYMYNLIVLNHKHNVTQRRFRVKNKMKRMSSMIAQINFEKFFPDSFKAILKDIKQSIQNTK